MMRTAVMCGCVVALASAPGAHAAFTGFTVTNVGTVGGRDVYRVFANFSAPTDILLNALKHNVTSGTMSNVVHNDFAGGSWSPGFTLLPEQAANDSFVTLTGLAGPSAQTNLDPSFGTGAGPTIPQNAGWFNSNPTSNIVVGPSLRIMIMQVALKAGTKGYSASLEVGYKESPSATQPLFGSGTYTIPAPGALALMMAASSLRRRRRSPPSP